MGEFKKSATPLLGFECCLQSQISGLAEVTAHTAGGTFFEMTGLLDSDLVRVCRTMTFASYLRQHAKACRKLSEALADEHLSDRIKAMAEDFLQKAWEVDDGHQKEF